MDYTYLHIILIADMSEVTSHSVFSNFADWITVIGFTLTLIGLIMTYRQGKKATTAAEAAKTSASATAKQINSLTAIEKNTKIIEHLNGCETQLRQNDWEGAISLLKSARIELISLQKRNKYKSVSDSSFNQICSDLQLDIDNLRQKNNGEDFDPDKTLINKHIDKAIEIFTLIHIELKDKYQNGESS